MLDFTVNSERCTKCGLCVQVCEPQVISLNEENAPFTTPESEENCMACQQCLAICPAAAISIFGKNPDDSLSLKAAGAFPSKSQMETLIRGRRSVRQYKNKNVDPQTLTRLLTTLNNAPRGVNFQDVTFHIIDDVVVMNQFRDDLYAALKKVSEQNAFPESFSFLEERVKNYLETGADIILRGAPHLLIVSEPSTAPCPSQDVSLMLAYFELLAQSEGLGTVWCGMLKMALEIAPELKDRLGLPEDHAYYGMLFGHPRLRYARTVQRDDCATIYRVK